MRVIPFGFVETLPVFRRGSDAVIADGFGLKIPKGYLYFALGFAVLIESMNHWMRKKKKARRKV